MRLLGLVAISLAAPAFALALRGPFHSERADENDGQRTVTMTGDAVVRVAPDLANVTVRIKREALTEDAARAAVSAPTAKTLQLLSAAGVLPADVRTDPPTLEERFALSPKGMQTDRVVGWIASRTITVCVHDLTRLSKLLDEAAAGSAIVESIVYDTSDLPALKERARQLAARAAREKATMLVEELGGHLGLPRTIGEGNYGWSGAYSWKNAAETVPDGAVVTADIATGLLRVDATVNVVFDIVK
ncbi:MAG: SIMPL domain-containing protein [Deltaproteobacteria bacterium]|nr:SIMPL domain-containing protein [Deltaproteobacteria bacterium]